MRSATSIYLDTLRWLAAVGVFLFHSGSFIAPWLLGVLRDQGSECVAVFFVLSGFVIRFVSSEKERDYRQYLRARAARLYSVTIVALVLTLAMDAIGTRLDPEFYNRSDWFNPSTSIWDIVTYLTFTNEIWFRHVVVGSAQPYWSLGFEAAYYLFFAAAVYAGGWKRVAWLALWAVVVGPKIISTLPLWLIGVATYDIVKSPKFNPKHPRIIGAALMLASLPLYILNKYEFWSYGAGSLFKPDSLQALLHSAGYMTVVGVAIAGNLIGFDLIARTGFQWPRGFGRTIRWLAGGSFTLYLVHEPMLALARAAYPDVTVRHGQGSVIMIGIFAATLLLAELGERRKALFRKIIFHTTAGRSPATG